MTALAGTGDPKSECRRHERLRRDNSPVLAELERQYQTRRADWRRELLLLPCESDPAASRAGRREAEGRDRSRVRTAALPAAPGDRRQSQQSAAGAGLVP